ncbi:class I SAM-dependent methyltransferase [Endozoicomonadaceae bacterium StTr2]
MPDVSNLKTTRVSSDQWAEYWSQGHLTTFGGPEFEDGYQGNIKSFWLQQLPGLDDGASIVDLGSGNGALPLLFARELEDGPRKISIVGIDNAAIAPSDEFKKYRKRDAQVKVRFKAETPMEDTRLKKNSTDLVVSHYGFEYGDPEKVVREIQRILKPAGKVAMIVHHEGSYIVRKARGMLEQARLGEDERLVNRVKKWVRDFAAGKPGTVLDKQAAQLEASFQRLRNQAEQFQDAHMLAILINGGMAIAMKVQADADEARSMLKEWITEYNAYRLRMEDICAVAYTNKSVSALMDMMKEQGLTECRMSVLNHENGASLGLAITARAVD